MPLFQGTNSEVLEGDESTNAKRGELKYNRRSHGERIQTDHAFYEVPRDHRGRISVPP